MKKIYSMVALAMAMGLSASAATPVNSQASLAENATCQKSVNHVSVDKTAMKKAVAKAPSRDDIVGPYSMTYLWLLSSADPLGGSASVTITAGASSKEVLLTIPAFSDGDFDATYDASTGVLSVPSGQFAFYSTSGNENVNLSFEQEIVIDPEAGTVEHKTLDKAEFTIDASGSFVLPDDVIICLRSVTGYYFAGGLVTIEAPDYFVYNASEWVDAGTAKFTDDLFNKFLKEEYRIGAYDVPVKYRSSTQEYMLYNPYAIGGWEEVNSGTQPGYIVFDISDPDCVVLRPVTNCGFALPKSEEDPTIEYYYPFNMEGYYYYTRHWEKEDIWMDYIANDDPISVYDKNTKTISVENLYFGTSDNPLAPYWFGAENLAHFTIVMDNVSTAGVKNIEFDENAPVKYFNLQGVEIANPAKGQIVIKTQGNKAEKVVVK